MMEEGEVTDDRDSFDIIYTHTQEARLFRPELVSRNYQIRYFYGSGFSPLPELRSGLLRLYAHFLFISRW